MFTFDYYKMTVFVHFIVYALSDIIHSLSVHNEWNLSKFFHFNFLYLSVLFVPLEMIMLSRFLKKSNFSEVFPTSITV